MKNEPLQNQLRELFWRRKSTGAGRAEWRAHPELELEARLTEALARMPDAPVPSNFSARVSRAVELEEARQPRKWPFIWNWHALLARAAVAAVVLVVAGLTIQQHVVNVHRARLARSVALLAAAEPLPTVDALKNFDAIQRMSQPARADEELLALAPEMK
jgi:hypothetical protein